MGKHLAKAGQQGSVVVSVSKLPGGARRQGTRRGKRCPAGLSVVLRGSMVWGTHCPLSPSHRRTIGAGFGTQGKGSALEPLLGASTGTHGCLKHEFQACGS